MTRKQIDHMNNSTNGIGRRVKFSLLRNGAGFMVKRITLLPDGTLAKTAAAQMWMGRVVTVTATLDELPAFLAVLKSNEAIGLGVCDRAPADLVTAKNLPEHPDAVARTQEFFKMPAGPALGFMDGDTAATPDELMAALITAVPAFAQAEMLFISSTSAGIFRTGEDKPVSESKGLHGYFTALEGADFPRFGTALCKRLWLAGFGHIEISEDGKLLVRQLIDAATFAPERIIFEAAPILGPGLERRPPAPRLIEGGPLDTSLCLDLTPEENARYEALVAAAKRAKEPEAQAIRDAYLMRRGREIAAKQKIPLAAAIQVVARAMEGQPLDGDFPLHFEKFGEVTVAEVLADPGKYDNQILLEPMEPYYKSKFCAIFFGNGGFNPCIYSQAHGGRTFPLAIPAVDGRAGTSPANGQRGGRPPATKLIADDFIRSEGIPFPIKRHRGQWFRFDGKGYRPATGDDQKGRVMAFLRKNHPTNATKNMAANIIEHLLAVDVAGVESHFAMPCWLPSGEPAAGWLAMRNGLVNVESLARRVNGEDVPEENVVRLHTEKLFSTFALPYDFDHQADCPQWMAYLAGVQPDPAMRELLQLLAGLALVPDTSYEVFFVLFGDGGCGKTVFLFVLENLVGPSNVCTLPLTKYAEKHSTHLLCEHLLNIVGDLPTSDGRTSLHAIEGVLKDVASGGLLACERKNQEPYQAHAVARCIFAANSLPNFADRSSGIWDRLRVIPFDVRFRGTEKQNPHLARDIVRTELPGIFNWAVQGLAMLRAMRQFPRGPRGEEIEAQHRQDCDHERQFLSERCEVASGAFLETQNLYFSYKMWAENSGYRPKNIANFTRDLRRVFPEAVEERRRGDGRRVRGFLNLREVNEPGRLI